MISRRRRAAALRAVSVVLSLTAAVGLAGVAPASAADPESGVVAPSSLKDNPRGEAGTPADSGDAFVGLTAAGTPGGAGTSADKDGVSPVSPQFDPAAVDRGDEPDLILPKADLPSQSFPAAEPLGDVAAVRRALGSAATTRVIVTTRPPAGTAVGDMAARRARVPEIVASLDGTGSTVVATGEVVPYVVAEVTTKGLDALLASGAAGGVAPDRALVTSLDSTLGVIGADVTNDQELRGGSDAEAHSWEVAVIDTGVRTTHNGFGGRVVDEACFTTDGTCPNGANAETGAGSGWTIGNDHGTHVAGISSSEDFAGHSGGVAQDTGIVAIRVFNSDGTAWDSTVLAGVDHALARELAGAKLAAINVSLGGVGAFDSACDSINPAMTAAFAAARDQGVVIAVATGNDAAVDGINYPACVTGATAVASTGDTDHPSSFSNVQQELTALWAPGEDVTSTSDTGDSAYATHSGTSMATPHVAGAVAALADCADWDSSWDGSNASLDDVVLSRLAATGVPVSDTRAGGTAELPRLDLLAAAHNWNNNDDFANAEDLPGTSGENVDYSHCSTTEPGEPTGLGVASTWYDFQAPANGILTLSTCDAMTTADTVLDVYTGDSVDALTPVVGSDDDHSCPHSILHSTVTLAATAGETYRIRIGVYAGGWHPAGMYNLTYSLIDGPSCNGRPASIIGTSGDDVLVGTPGDDVIVAGQGDDVVEGADGDDTICLGAGDDYATGGEGHDWVSGGPGGDLVEGGPGDDIIKGGNDNDSLYGNDGMDDLYGDRGDDYLSGEGGDDYLSGHGGEDWANGGDDDDVVYGGPDDDWLAGDAGADAVAGHDGDDTLYGGADKDTVSGNAGADWIDTGDGDDLAYGGPGGDTMYGGAGADSLIAQGGDDWVYGGPDADYLSGGLDVDLCDGEAGIDRAHGSCETIVSAP